MKIKLQLIVTLPVGWIYKNKIISTATEIIAWDDEKTDYCIDYYDQTVPHAINSACKSLGLDSASDLRKLLPEISVYFFSDDGCRPSLHINAETISLMSDAGCSFDFDPYVYEGKGEFGGHKGNNGDGCI
jgi:hypothetical protein